SQQRLLAPGTRKAGTLMNLHAHTVTEPMAKLAAVSIPLDQLARYRIELAAAGTGPDRVQRTLLGREDELVDIICLSGDARAVRIRAGAVRAVALVAGSPVDREQHVAGNRLLAWSGVRQSGVRAGGDDRGEAWSLGAEPAHAQLQLDRHLALGSSNDTAFE